MNAERTEAGDEQLDQRLLTREIISGHTPLGREGIYRAAALASGFTLIIIPEGEEIRRAVDPKYDDEDAPIPARSLKPYVETVPIPEGSFGYYIQRPQAQTNHAVFWEAVAVEALQS